MTSIPVMRRDHYDADNDGTVDAVPLSDDNPQALGTAAAGTGSSAARSDHVHAMPNRARGAYDAIVYIQDGDVIAEDCDGSEIDSGASGTDDSAVLNAAASCLPGRMYVHTGNYTISDTILVKSYSHIAFSPGALLSRAPDAAFSLIKNVNWNAGVITDEHILIEGGKYDGVPLTYPAGASWYNRCLVLLGYCKQSGMRSLRGYGSSHYGIVLRQCEDSFIENSSLIGNKVTWPCGFAITGGKRNRASGLLSYENNRGIFIGGYGVSDTVISQSTFYQDSIGYTIYLENSVNGVEISDSVIYTTDDATGVIHYDANTTKLKFNNCVFDGSIAVQADDGYETTFHACKFLTPALYAYSDNLSIVACEFYGTTGIRATKRMRVTGCKFLDNNYGITINDAAVDGYVKDCDFQRCTIYGIYSIDGAGAIRISSNNFEGCATAIRLSANSPGSAVTDNSFVSNSAVFLDPANISKVLRNVGYVTENSGTSTGTGSEQTIAHGLVAAPSKVAIVPTETGATVSSWWADATNIYCTVATGKAFNWSAEV